MYKGEKVFVYYDLAHKCWSLRSLATGRVLNYRPLEGGGREKVLVHQIALENCTFRVSQAGRARVLATGHKNVHAGVVGTVRDLIAPDGFVKVRYNPRLFSTFVEESTLQPVESARVVLLAERQVFALV